jgi:predicted TIM-barrel fold metal-dependent hydrolase
MARLAISADSHILEARDVFVGLAEKFGDRAPRVVHEEGKGDFIDIPATGKRLNAAIGGVGRLGIAGMSLADPETHRIIALGYDGLKPALVDPVERTKAMDTDGVWAEVIYPSVFMRLFGIPDADVLAAAFSNYNDWLWDFCATVPDRLTGLALLVMQDPVAAHQELKRAIARGYKGVCIPCAAPNGTRYSDPVYDPIWATAEEAGIPINMHIFTHPYGAVTGLDQASLITEYASAPTLIQYTLSDLISGGVAHRYPNLKFIAAEFNTGWVANWLERMDHAVYRARTAVPDYMDMKPSEYWRRQFYATFEDDRPGMLTRDSIGVETMMWGNDFPHHDSVWPHSQEVLDMVFEGIPDSVRQTTTVGNVARLYGLSVQE